MGLAESLKETYSRAAAEVRKKTDSFLARHKAKAERLLKQVQEGKISEKEYKDWLNGQVFIGKRWKEKLDDITQTYVDADEKARKIINGTNKNEFVRFANIQGNDIKNHVAGYSFDVYDKHTVERLLKEDPKMLPEWKINEPKDYRWNYTRVKNEITQGIIQGESIPDIAKRLSSGLATDNKKKMTLFARTAITGAQNAGRMERLHEAKGMGVQVKKKWLATLDKRTRDAHAELDGQEVDVDEKFKVTVDGKEYEIDYPGDPNADPSMTYNCRCTLTYVYKGFSKSGERRDNETDEIVKPTTYRAWRDKTAESKPFIRAASGQARSVIDRFGVTLKEQSRKEIVEMYQGFERIDGITYTRDANGNVSKVMAKREAYDELDKMTDKLVNRIVEQNETEAAAYKDLNKYLRENPLYFSEYDRHDIADFGKYAKSSDNFVRMTLKQGGMSVDTAYEQFKEMYPEYFTDEHLTPSDRLLRINDVMGMLKAQKQSTVYEKYSPDEVEKIKNTIWGCLNRGYYEVLRKAQKGRKK